MEFKGTKGKWRLEKSQFYSDRICVFSDFENKFSDKLILSIDNCDNQEGKANALLISKAPEMLEMLESLENDDNAIPAIIWNKIQKLIKEATEL